MRLRLIANLVDLGAHSFRGQLTERSGVNASLGILERLIPLRGEITEARLQGHVRGVGCEEAGVQQRAQRQSQQPKGKYKGTSIHGARL
jgi:hypothetical protein